MGWDEAMIRYALDRLCTKMRPWGCDRCPLERWKGCWMGIQINALKEWAEKNISPEILEEKRASE